MAAALGSTPRLEQLAALQLGRPPVRIILEVGGASRSAVPRWPLSEATLDDELLRLLAPPHAVAQNTEQRDREQREQPHIGVSPSESTV